MGGNGVMVVVGVAVVGVVTEGGRKKWVVVQRSWTVDVVIVVEQVPMVGGGIEIVLARAIGGVTKGGGGGGGNGAQGVGGRGGR